MSDFFAEMAFIFQQVIILESLNLGD